MTVEDWTGPMSDHEEQWSRIEFITRQHTPFADEPFHPRSVVAHIRIWPRLPFTRAIRLNPVAFEPHIVIFEMMGLVSVSGGMQPYLFLDPDKRLVRRVTSRKQTGSRQWQYVTDPSSLDSEDIRRLEIGIKGDFSLIEGEFEAALADIMNDLELP